MSDPIRLNTAIACIVLAGITPAFGTIFLVNERLDHAIPRNALKLIIAGEIAEIRREPAGLPPRVIVTGPDKIDIKFAVNSVLLGNQSFAKQKIPLPLTAFVWPEELVPLEEGSRCILVLEDDRWMSSPLCVRSVVPARTTTFAALSDGEAAKNLIAHELLEILRVEASPNRQRLLILQAAPILSAAQTSRLVPFLQSDKIWLRRAALAALAYATKDESYIKTIESDLKQFLEQTAPNDLVTDIEPPNRWAAYALLFKHYFFLSTDWSAEETQMVAPFLPLFRLVAKAPHLEKVHRWQRGIGPLCRLGTKEDLRFLYGCCGREEILFPSGRQEIIMAVSRVLDLGLENWAEKEFLERGAQQHQAVTDALIHEGIIQASDAHNHRTDDK